VSDEGVPLTAEGILQGAEAEKIDARSRKTDLTEKQDALKLRRAVSWGAIGLMVAQIVAADAVFIGYSVGEHWRMPVGAIQAWLAATVVQVVSVVLVITRYLFPSDGPR